MSSTVTHVGRVALACVAVALLATACGDDPVDVSSGTTATAVPGASTTTEAPSTTVPASTTTETTTAPPTTGPVAATPEEALEAYITGAGLEYAGDCDDATLEDDIGKECTSLVEDRGDERIYDEGPTFSQYDTYLLVREGANGWAVVDTASSKNAQPHPW